LKIANIEHAMSHASERHYQRIEHAIHYITEHLNEQPSLETIAAAVGMSPSHFQRVFTQWAGVSPKKFMQFVSLQECKALLKARKPLAEVAHHVGLSGTSRIHDLFVQIEGMTPGDYKLGGQGLTITYAFEESPFGSVIVASTEKGVCHLAFEADKKSAVRTLQSRFPNAAFRCESHPLHAKALQVLNGVSCPDQPLMLHLAGTPFQLKVWEALLKIPHGTLYTYRDIADLIDKPTASRAVGTAIGKNPVAYLIPCHRVIQTSGQMGGYMWGIERKHALIGFEAAQYEAGESSNGSV
jgi:AraC family transcriptional regulator of adaptative response/methylated-DNA-[protein]-cysteine methyltransferase